MNNMNTVIANFDQNIKNAILSEIDKLSDCVEEMHKIYFEHENFFDNKSWTEKLSLDNVQSLISYELPYILEGFSDCQDYTNVFNADKEYFEKINDQMDTEGYGVNAMARGFSASNPCSLLWVETTNIIMILNEINEIIEKNYVK